MKNKKLGTVLVAFLLFASILIWISMQMSSTLPYYHGESVSNIHRTQAFQITDMLLKSEDSYGLSNGTPYVLDETKMNNFDGQCQNNYVSLVEDLGLNNITNFQLEVEETKTSGDIHIDCRERIIPSTSSPIIVKRYAVTEDKDEVSVVFRIW